MKKLFSKVIGWISGVWKEIKPDQGSWKGAALGIALLSVLPVFILTWNVFLPSGILSFILYTFALFAAAALLGFLIVLVRKLINCLPARFIIAFSGTAVLLLIVFALDFDLAVLLLLALILCAGLAGAGLSTVFKNGMRGFTRLRKISTVSALVLGVVGLLLSAVWLLLPGGFAGRDARASMPVIDTHILLSADDPSLPGKYSFTELSYGSGEDKHRAEFADEITLQTDPVDGSKLVIGWSKLRTRYWGFDEKSLPLNARVWMPEGEGPFSLVLIVHGNHLAEDYSDTGYAYLGELFASRGFITASIDENFLNSSPAMDLFFLKGLEQENDLRALLLLEHLQCWREWNIDEATPFYDKINLQNIALIGHSRGGEAVALAAAFNDLDYYPDDAHLMFDYHFGIRSVIAIAPVDGQYYPAGRSTPLGDINYFVLHGSHDMDVSSFDGMNQYERIELSPQSEYFKSALYIVGANHGQFNSSWGRADMNIPASWIYDLKQLLPAEEQKQIAKVCISAFLESTLHDQREYESLFLNPYAGSEWLPETRYFSRFQEGNSLYLSDFEEDIDLSSGSLPGVNLFARNLDKWREDVVRSKWGKTDTSAVHLNWDVCEGEKEASYRIDFTEVNLELSSDSILIFSLADTDEMQPGCQEEDEEARDDGDEWIDLTIQVQDQNGQSASLPLSTFLPLSPLIEVQVHKSDIIWESSAEPVFQDYAFPLALFADENIQLQPEKIVSVHFVFDQTLKGSLILDDIGFRYP